MHQTEVGEGLELGIGARALGSGLELGIGARALGSGLELWDRGCGRLRLRAVRSVRTMAS